MLLLCLFAAPAAARVLQVGPTRPYPQPSAAAAVAQDGDTVAIDAGSYDDCAEWHANHLTISGPETTILAGPQAVLTCLGNAAFVIRGNDVVVRNLSFERSRTPDGNGAGAGIRAESRDLTVQDSRFVNNPIGILANGADGGFLRVIGCGFVANGSSLDGQPTHGLQVGALDLLRVEQSTFQNARGGDHIVSYSQRTDLLDNRLADEGGRMSGPLVLLSGGAVTLDGNTVLLAPDAAERPGAILAVGDVSLLAVRGNTLIEPAGSVPLVRNWSGAAAIVDANVVPPNVVAVSDAGALYHRVGNRLATLRDLAYGAFRFTREQVNELIGRLKPPH